jgi:transcriptional regulator with XRE-family HTH domain
VPSTNTRALSRVVGRWIRRLRLKRRWAQVDLVAHLDEAITQAAVSGLESGKFPPSLDTLARLARAFEVEPALLLLDQESARSRLAAEILTCSKEQLDQIAKAIRAVKR